ncbi:CLUMA_CG008663, isoform A, partial [Clunio marinus]
MSILLASCFILLLSYVNSGLSESETLIKFLETEKMFIGDLEDYIERQESVLHVLRKKLLNFKVEHSDAVENPDSYFSNELNRFLFVKRLFSDVELLSEKTFKTADTFKSKVNSYKRGNILPSKNDLSASVLSIARLQEAQSLRTDKLAKGIFGDVKRRSGLSTEDCYQVGKQLNAAHVYSSATEWLTEAMKRYDEYYDQHQVKAVDILEELALSFIGNNRLKDAEGIVEKVSRMNSKSHVVELFFKYADRLDSLKDEKLPTDIDTEELCHPIHFFKSNIFTCPI